MGRQPTSNVYVLGPNLQFYSDGIAIPPEEQKFVWVSCIINKLKISNILHPVSVLPDVPQPLSKLMKGLVHVMGSNWPSAVFVLGMIIPICSSNYSYSRLKTYMHSILQYT